MRDHERWNLGNKALTALRGGYIGVLMFGMLGSVVGMSLINPFSVGAGVLLGGKAIVDERRRIIARRQSEAKAAVRRHVDEVVFQVGKDSREMLRVVQRDLRDHYSELADQLNRSIRESVASAERSVQATQAERERRLTEIGTELSALGALRAHVETLLAPADSGAVRPDPADPPGPVQPSGVADPEAPADDPGPLAALRDLPTDRTGRGAPHEEPLPRPPVPGRRGLVLVDPPTGTLPRAVPPQPQQRDVPRPAPSLAARVPDAPDDVAQQPRIPAQRTPPVPRFEGRATAGGASPPDQPPRPSKGQPPHGVRRRGRHSLRRARLRRVTPLLFGTRQALSAAAHAYRNHPAAAHRCAVLARRLDGPLRVALAGRVKAGKSTLLNALVGDRLAPADVGECTRVVTWYRSAPAPRITLEPRAGSPRPLPVHRREVPLEVDLDDSADVVERLVIEWPAPGLRDWTVIDTPGVASLSADVSARATQLLDPAGGSDDGADAVIYLMRHVHAADVDLLQTLRGPRSSRFVNTVAVLSRADEIGSGRTDAMDVAAAVAHRYRRDPTVRGLCLDVVAVAGLLAETGRTIDAHELLALHTLAAVPPAVLDEALRSADRFLAAADVDVSPERRGRLLDRLGVFGIRTAVKLIVEGTSGTAELGEELVRRSGLIELQASLATRFRDRREVLVARSVLLGMRRLFRDEPVPGTAALAVNVGRMLRSAHELVELRALAAYGLRRWHCHRRPSEKGWLFSAMPERRFTPASGCRPTVRIASAGRRRHRRCTAGGRGRRTRWPTTRPRGCAGRWCGPARGSWPTPVSPVVGRVVPVEIGLTRIGVVVDATERRRTELQRETGWVEEVRRRLEHPGGRLLHTACESGEGVEVVVLDVAGLIRVVAGHAASLLLRCRRERARV